jgi:hypothetical protein
VIPFRAASANLSATYFRVSWSPPLTKLLLQGLIKDGIQSGPEIFPKLAHLYLLQLVRRWSRR